MLSACASGPAEQPRPELVTTPESLLQRGIKHFRDNDLVEANRNFQQALQLYRSIDDPDGIMRSCLNLAKLNTAVNNDERAAIYLDRAAQTARTNTLPGYDQHIAILRSTLLIRQGETATAADMLADALQSADSTTRLAALKNRTVIAFTDNDTDRTQWLQRYRTENTAAGNRPSHRARILRFDAELAEDLDDQDSLLKQALAVSRQETDSLAIAATLTQWGDIIMGGDIALASDDLKAAEDRYLRALFIRHQFGDRTNTSRLLEKLQLVYTRQAPDGDATRRLDRTRYWLDRIGQNQLADWPQLMADFDYFPH
jgi:Tfp pilus assembly protein PilF